MLKLVSVTMAEPHRKKVIIKEDDIFRAAVQVAQGHFKLGHHCHECVEQERLIEAGDGTQVLDHGCGKMMELSLQERCNHLCELWCPTEILDKCEDVALNMDWCVAEVQKNFLDKQWLEEVVKCCFFLF